MTSTLREAARSERHLAIVNPRAGAGRCARLVGPALERLRAGGLKLEVATTSGPGHGVSLAAQGFAGGCRRFLAVGGDGTAFEVLNGFLPASLATGERCALALLPLGTGNSFVGDLTTGGAETVIEALLLGRSRACDVLRMRNAAGEIRYAIGQIALGFPGQVAALVNRRLKRFGTLGYTLGVLLELARLRPLQLGWRVDQGPARRGAVTFLFFNNNVTTGGNMRMAPGADPSDGVGDLLLVDPVSRTELLRTFPKLFTGRHVENPNVHQQRLKRLELDVAQELDVLVDGEVFRERPASVEIVPGAIDVVV